MARRRVRTENFGDRAGRRAADALALPADAFARMPRITVTGNRELLLEGHTGVVSYDPAVITLGGGIYLVEVSGKNLEMHSFSKESIGIRGVITAIRFVL